MGDIHINNKLLSGCPKENENLLEKS